MTAPSPAVRAVTYERDGHRCVSCGSTIHLEYQHRRGVGMGGGGKPPGFVDGVTSCHWCNSKYEGEWQARALRMGWKVRRWVKDPALIPVYYLPDNTWFVLSRRGTRMRISEAEATQMLVGMYGQEWWEGSWSA